MAELVNLRTARKQAKRRKDEERARTNRFANGQPKRLRKLQHGQRDKADRHLDAHRIETGDAR